MKHVINTLAMNEPELDIIPLNNLYLGVIRP